MQKRFPTANGRGWKNRIVLTPALYTQKREIKTISHTKQGGGIINKKSPAIAEDLNYCPIISAPGLSES
jgi:hypothetical protein